MKTTSAAGDDDFDRIGKNFLKGMALGLGTIVATAVLGPIVGPVVAMGIALANGNGDDGAGTDAIT
jgi:hypothetical protein